MCFYSFSDSLLNIEVAFVVQENVSMFLQCFVFVLLGSLKDNHVLQQYVCNVVYSNFVFFFKVQWIWAYENVLRFRFYHIAKFQHCLSTEKSLVI